MTNSERHRSLVKQNGMDGRGLYCSQCIFRTEETEVTKRLRLVVQRCDNDSINIGDDICGYVLLKSTGIEYPCAKAYNRMVRGK